MSQLAFLPILEHVVVMLPAGEQRQGWMLLDQVPTCAPKLQDYFPLNMGWSQHFRGKLLWIPSLFSKFRKSLESCCVQGYLWPWARKQYFISSPHSWVPARDPDVGDTELWFPALFILQMSLVVWSRCCNFSEFWRCCTTVTAVGWCNKKRCFCQKVKWTSSKKCIKWIYPTTTWKCSGVLLCWWLFNGCMVIVLTACLLLNAKDLIRMGSSALAFSENVQEIWLCKGA